MMSACSLVLSRRPTTLPARSIGRGARCSFALAPPRLGSMKGRSAVMMSVPCSGVVFSMHRVARFVPAVAHRRNRTDSARDDEVQAVHVLHGLDRVLVVVGIDPHRARTLGAP